MSIFNLFKKKAPDPIFRPAKYKDFPVSGFKQYVVNSFKIENDDYELGAKGILNECLEDEKIYRYDYQLLPSLSDNGNGYDVIARDVAIGKIQPDIADALDNFLADHPDHELLLTIEGGPYKIYDSENEELKTGSDKYTVNLCVKYYVAESK